MSSRASWVRRSRTMVSFPQTTEEIVDAGFPRIKERYRHPIFDVFDEEGVKFAFEDPAEIAFDYYSAVACSRRLTTARHSASTSIRPTSCRKGSTVLSLRGFRGSDSPRAHEGCEGPTIAFPAFSRSLSGSVTPGAVGTLSSVRPWRCRLRGRSFAELTRSATVGPCQWSGRTARMTVCTVHARRPRLSSVSTSRFPA